MQNKETDMGYIWKVMCVRFLIVISTKKKNKKDLRTSHLYSKE